MTNDEYRYMLDLKGLDDINLGMMEPSTAVRMPTVTRDRCFLNGWTRIKSGTLLKTPLVIELRTAGLRALQREARRRQMATG